jgi:hypothetical protein
MGMKHYNEREYNRLCAEFLGWKQNSKKTTFYVDKNDSRHIYEIQDLKFHSNWEWIMEVVEKINDTPIEDDFIECIEAKYLIFQRLGKTYKLAVVEAIWQFLNWFNEQKQ